MYSKLTQLFNYRLEASAYLNQTLRSLTELSLHSLLMISYTLQSSNFFSPKQLWKRTALFQDKILTLLVPKKGFQLESQSFQGCHKPAIQNPKKVTSFRSLRNVKTIPNLEVVDQKSKSEQHDVLFHKISYTAGSFK